MDQKREKEETELKVPEAITLCTPSITAGKSNRSGSDELRSSPDRSDLNSGNVLLTRSSSGSSPERPDLFQNSRLLSPDRSDLKTGNVLDSRSSSGSSTETLNRRQNMRLSLPVNVVESRSSSGSSPETTDLFQNSRLSLPDRSESNAGNVVEFRSSFGISPEEESNGIKRRVTRVVNRCSGCRRKVGLMGFRCRCGEIFCSDHRYSDRHDCCYDYKAAGREAIARENPVVRAAKILKV